MSDAALLPVTVIGGYLGAGKTTLINQMLRHADGTRIAILVNEFGALPIDEDLIEAEDDDIISIAGGCVCCSYGNDLVQAMMTLSDLDPRPDHVVLEASGVALPGAIAASLALVQGVRLDGIVVVADAETIRRQAEDPYVGDTVERQLHDADIILLNKSDLVTADALDATAHWLAHKAAHAEVVPTRQCAVPNAVILHALAPGSAPPRAGTDHEVGIFETRFVAVDRAVDAAGLARRLAHPSLTLIRAKGFVTTPTGPKTIQVVGRRWAVTDAPPGAQPGLVVIALASKLDLDAVHSALATE